MIFDVPRQVEMKDGGWEGNKGKGTVFRAIYFLQYFQLKRK
jgi:hypothetical protein